MQPFSDRIGQKTERIQVALVSKGNSLINRDPLTAKNLLFHV